VAALDHSDVQVVLVGEDRLEAITVVSVKVTCAPRRGRSRRTISRDPSGHEDRSMRSVISATSPFSRSDPFWFRAGTQAFVGISRIA
jgi:hypothetical protein